jgi:hypothetical protein
MLGKDGNKVAELVNRAPLDGSAGVENCPTLSAEFALSSSAASHKRSSIFLSLDMNKLLCGSLLAFLIKLELKVIWIICQHLHLSMYHSIAPKPGVY